MNSKFLSMLTAVLFGANAMAEIQIQNGEKVAFLGDSITQAGAATPSGYCRLVESALKAQNINASMVFAGIGGHKSDQMLERLDADVLIHKPDWMVLSCGVNDVWHAENGVELPEYKANITQIVEKAQASGAKVILLTATVIFEDLNNDFNRKLKAYNDFLKQLAEEKNCIIADPNTTMQNYLIKAEAAGQTPRILLTTDGVHMNPYGNMIMAVELLKSIGFSDEQLANTQKVWFNTPNACVINGTVDVSISQYEKLYQLAQENNITLQQQVDTLLEKALNEI